MGHGAEPVDVGALLGGGVRVILDLALSLLALVAAILAIGVAGWILDAIEWLRGLLRLVALGRSR